jgi:26S proteasome regulatory subunit N10
MPEATIVILDNSNYSINGDYQPTRWMSQIDAAGLLIQTKMEHHHENAMGIALSAGVQVEIICSPSTDLPKVTSHLYGIKTHGLQKLSIVLFSPLRLFRPQPSP